MKGREIILYLNYFYQLTAVGFLCAQYRTVGPAYAKLSPRTSVEKVSANVTKLLLTDTHVFNTA